MNIIKLKTFYYMFHIFSVDYNLKNFFQVMDKSKAQLWFAGKELICGKKLSDYIGKNDKTKVKYSPFLSLNLLFLC